MSPPSLILCISISSPALKVKHISEIIFKCNLAKPCPESLPKGPMVCGMWQRGDRVRAEPAMSQVFLSWPWALGQAGVVGRTERRVREWQFPQGRLTHRQVQFQFQMQEAEMQAPAPHIHAHQQAMPYPADRQPFSAQNTPPGQQQLSPLFSHLLFRHFCGQSPDNLIKVR